MVDPVNQRHIAERPNDLRATLCNTCRAKEILHFEAKKTFQPTIATLIEEGKKRNAYLDPFWERNKEYLEREIPGWREKSLTGKNDAVSAKLAKNPRFLAGNVDMESV